MILGASLATAGYIKVHNRTNDIVRVRSYNADDVSLEFDYEDKGVGPDGVAEVRCATSEGCKLFVGVPGQKGFVDKTFQYNGVYHLDGRWHSNGPGVTVDEPITFTRAPSNGTEVTIPLVALPVPGGGVSDCLFTNQPNVLLDNGKVELDWQGDGNLVLYRKQDGVPLWVSGTAGKATHMCLQGDGNLVIYNGGGVAWASNTDGRGAALKLLSSCEAVIPDRILGGYLWASETHCE